MNTLIHINKTELKNCLKELKKYNKWALTARLINKLNELSKNSINNFVYKDNKKYIKLEIYQKGALYREWKLDNDCQPITDSCKKYLYC